MPKDAELVFGAALSSADEIIKDLRSIVSQVESSGVTKLKFGIDTKSITNEINAIQKITNSGSLGNKLSAEIKQNNADWKALERQMIQVNNFDWNCLKTNLKAQQQEIAANNAEWKRLEAEMYKVNNAEWNGLKEKLSADEKELIANNREWQNLEKQVEKVNNAEWNGLKEKLSADEKELIANNREWQNLEKQVEKVNNAEWNGLKEKLSADEKELIANNREWQNLEKQVEKSNNAEWNGLKEKLRQDNQALKDNEKDLRDHETQTRQNTNAQLQYNKILSQAQDYYKKYSKNIQKKPSLNKDWQEYIERLSTDPDNNFAFSQDARNQLALLQRSTREAGFDVETLGQKLKNLFDQHLSTAVAMVGVHLLQRSLRDVYQNVKDIDTAMTELKKVTDETSATYSRFLDNASSRAQKIGSEISDVIQATADFSRLGYNLEDSKELADAALVYKNVGD